MFPIVITQNVRPLARELLNSVQDDSVRDEEMNYCDRMHMKMS